MNSLKFCTFFLFVLSSHALCDCFKLLGKKADGPKDYTELQQQQQQFITPEQQISHAAAVAESVLKDPARQKRSQSDLSNSEFSSDFSDIIDELEDNALTSSFGPYIDFENMSPWVYQRILQNLKQLANERAFRVLTPRLGRSIDFRRHLDTTFGVKRDNAADGGDTGTYNIRQQKPFVSRLIKKSVPFKPRLGKRIQPSMLCD